MVRGNYYNRAFGVKPKPSWGFIMLLRLHQLPMHLYPGITRRTDVNACQPLQLLFLHYSMNVFSIRPDPFPLTCNMPA